MLYQLSYSRPMALSYRPLRDLDNLGRLGILTWGSFWWRGEDSNLRRPEAGRFTVCSV